MENNPIYLQWQQWESRVQEWLNQSDDDLDLPDTVTFDRVILTLLAVKYHVLYRDMDEGNRSAGAKKHGKRKPTIKLSRAKAQDTKKERERHRDKERLFETFTGCYLSPEQVSNETSAEWQEFCQLYEWHGLEFLRRFEQCLRQFVSELISMTSAYQELIGTPALVPPVVEIENQVYEAKNDREVFISIDIKSANFALLQHIHAIDAHTYPTWSDFLSFFVGSKPVLIQSKILRMRCLGELPQFSKLQALWTHFTATIYKKIIRPCLDEKDVDASCVALTGDEMVFHLYAPIKDEKAIDLVNHMQRLLTKQSPIVKFSVQAYRLRVFHWKKEHRCFARLFIGQGDAQFDLKCVPQKVKNYERACADFRMLFGL